MKVFTLAFLQTIYEQRYIGESWLHKLRSPVKKLIFGYFQRNESLLRYTSTIPTCPYQINNLRKLITLMD